MTVEQLIVELQKRDPASQVLVEGAADTYWAVSDVTDDDSATTAFLLVGDEVAVRTDD